MSKEELAPLLEALEILKTYLPDIVLVGGWVPAVYKHFTGIYNAKTAIRTYDIDIACPSKVRPRGKLMDDLLLEGGYKARIQGSTDVGVCKYVKGSSFEIEFLTPLKGSGTERVKKVQEKLTAEALRYLDILLDNVEVVSIRPDLPVRVPKIGAFLFHKGLIFKERREAFKRDKDLLYIYQALQAVEQDLLIKGLDDTIKRVHPKWKNKFTKNMESFFRDMDSMGPLVVADQLREMPEEYNPEDDMDSLRMKVFATVSEFMESVMGLS